MKKLLLVLLLLAFAGNFSFSQEPWSTVKPPLGKYVKLPAVVQTWDNPNKLPMIYNTRAGVLAVGANFRVLPNTNQQDEILLVSNPSWPNLLFGSSNSTVGGSTYRQGVYVSTNGGVNWYGTDVMPNCPLGASDPAPAIDRYGNFVFTTLNTSGSVSMIGLYSTNYGVNWSTPFTIPGGSPSDKNMTATDDVPSSPYYGRTYTVWSKTSGTWPIMVSYTTNSGVSWSTAAQINTPPTTSQGCDVVVGPGGVVYVTWSKQSSVSIGVGFAKSTDGGVTWTVNETAFAVTGMRSSSFNGWGVRVNDFPRIACDKSGGANNGKVYIVDCEKNSAPAGTDPDVVIHSSTNGGTTWSAGIRVNQDVLNNGKVQFFPAVCVDGSGGVNVIYYDNRNYPSVGDSCETVVSRSIDGGITWTDILVSDHRWKPQGEPGLGTYMGDYIGITAGNGKVWPFWFDNKSGSFQAWTAPIDLGPSILHTPLTSTEQTTGTRPVNCVITPAGSPINPSTVKLYYSKDNPTLTSNITMTNSSGDNWTAALPLSGAGLYRYYITATDNLSRTVTYPSGAPANTVSFTASADITPPVITHTTLADVPKGNWPATVSATVTDNIGVDSVWVKWYKNTPAILSRQFRLPNAGGSTYTAAFNSIQTDVSFNDSIFYRVFARDNSSGHNVDSTSLRKFKIIAQATSCIGTGTTATSYPFYTLYEDSRTQMLYTASEIIAGGGAAGFINKLGFKLLTVGSPAMSNFSIKMQTITASTISTWTTTGWTNVYSSASYTPPGTGLQYIDLTTPYLWNGTGNLLVEVCFDNAAWSSNSTVEGTAQTGTVVHNHVDGSAGCSLTATSTAATRPNVCMIINTAVGVNPVGNTVPSVFSLSQNYPNPFNPTTQIRYDIPKQSFVTLKVYDLLGREMTKLVNEVKQPGSFIVDFNASSLSSGVYFYKLQAGEFESVKRMVLVK